MAAAAYARRRGAPGLVFASYGRRAGLQALLAGRPEGVDMMLTPVHIVRYWEFAFVRRQLPYRIRGALDVASPRLFSYYAADRGLADRIEVINPDVRDADATSALARVLGYDSISVAPIGVEDLASSGPFDAIWSISVVEHIRDDGDLSAMETMWRALRPGGRLIVTVPVDRRGWDEYRDVDTYGLGTPEAGGRYFFQRWYDADAIERRLIASVGTRPRTIEWFGEREPGTFQRYERDWMARGHACTVEDPRRIADDYRPFHDWTAMSGQGVAGLSFVKEAA
jgi:SAM-dependent methyltransferase